MPVPYVLRLPVEGRESISISGEFSDEDHRVLLAYLQECQELIQCKPFKEVLSCRISISGTVGQPIEVDATLPPSDDLSILLHRLRPLILETEPASYVRVCSVLGKIDNTDFRALLKRNRKLYDGRDFQEQVKLELNEVALNCERVLQDWLNSYEYHRDPAKRKRIDHLFELLPSDLLRAILILLLIDKTHAVGDVSSIIFTMLGSTFPLQKPG